MIYTEDQKLALQMFEDFMNSDHQNPCFILKGYAGTGKTTLISKIIEGFKKQKIKAKLIAPTGRAAKVMSNYAKYPAQTIHKLIYFVGEDFNGNGLVKAKNMFQDTLFIVDEASMLGIDDQSTPNNLLEDLLNFVYSGKDCKLMMVGDPGQLPPVGQDDSPAIHLDYLKHHFPQLELSEIVLKQVVRQASDAQITENATYIRNLEGVEPPYFIKSGRDVISIQSNELLDRMESELTNGLDSFVLLTMSNKRANKWNVEIRNRLLGFEEDLVRGDILMVVKNNYHWALGTQMGFIANGEMVRLEKIISNEHLYGFDFVKARISFVDYPENDELEVVMMKDALISESPSIPRDKLKVLFFEIEKDYAQEKNKRKRYQMIMKDPYFNALQIKYATAITAHKSQGGQWDTVFLDYGFIPENMDKSGYLRWLYTCITRAKSKLYLLNFPKNFFAN